MPARRYRIRSGPPRRQALNSPRRIRARVSVLALLLMLLASAANSPPDKVEAPGAPTSVAMSASNRRFTVAWREMPGAASYKIAVRLKNELVPAWREYMTPSSPCTIANMWAMSGMAYEVRVAAVNARGQSEWSAPVSITAPVLQAAPADAISTFSPPVVGEVVAVDLHSQRPFTNRSRWHWLICSADGLDCKVLPKRQQRPTWEYFMEHSMEGKYLSVWVDYDKEGVSYSATETGRAETLALGLRNPQGLARDAAGHLWETEHGPQGGDELNVLVAGGNYGWPQVTYGVEYGSKVNVPRAAEVGLHDGFIKPVFAWVPSIGISSVIVNDERWFPLWKDDLLIGSLSGTQGSGNALFRVWRDGTDVQYVERIEVGSRIRDLAQMPDRRIALLLDEGWVLFLSRSYADCADEFSVYAVDCKEGRP